MQRVAIARALINQPPQLTRTVTYFERMDKQPLPLTRSSGDIKKTSQLISGEKFVARRSTLPEIDPLATRIPHLAGLTFQQSSQSRRSGGSGGYARVTAYEDQKIQFIGPKNQVWLSFSGAVIGRRDPVRPRLGRPALCGPAFPVQCGR